MAKETKPQEKSHMDDMQNDLAKYKSLDVLRMSEGGQILVDGLMADIISNVESLAERYSTLTQQEFISLCAGMKEKLDLVRVIRRSKKHEEEMKELIAQALSE